MKIAIVGYGQMGKEVQKIATERNHKISFIVDDSNKSDIGKISAENTDVVIEFTNPDSAPDNYKRCFLAGVPVISGTTGWLDKLPQVEEQCKKQGGGFFYASNFSLGVNLFFCLNKKLARLMSHHKTYNVSITETHHTRKLDAPSGTAITLAQDIISQIPELNGWASSEKLSDNEIPILSYRKGDVPGTHKISFDSDIDNISIQHEAKSRKGFAMGAVLAAEFMLGKKGIYGMDDLLKLS